MSALRRRLERHDSESGLSLPEVLVASLLLVTVIMAAGGLLQSTAESARDVQSAAAAGTATQVVVLSVEAGVRNAAALRYTRSGTGGSDELLVARSQLGASSGPTWYCQAWFYSADRDTVHHRRSPVTGTPGVITAPTGANPVGWTTMAADVVPRPGASGVFTPRHGDTQVDIELARRDDARLRGTAISTSVVRRPQGQSGGAPCF